MVKKIIASFGHLLLLCAIVHSLTGCASKSNNPVSDFKIIQSFRDIPASAIILFLLMVDSFSDYYKQQNKKNGNGIGASYYICHVRRKPLYQYPL